MHITHYFQVSVPLVCYFSMTNKKLLLFLFLIFFFSIELQVWTIHKENGGSLIMANCTRGSSALPPYLFSTLPFLPQQQSLFPHPTQFLSWPCDLLWPVRQSGGDSELFASVGLDRFWCVVSLPSLGEQASASLLVPWGGWETCGAEPPGWTTLATWSPGWKKVKVRSLSHVRLFATPWTVAY